MTETILTSVSLLITIVFIFAYIPQTRELISIKTAAGVSPLFWAFIALSTTLSAYNAVTTGNGGTSTYYGAIYNASMALILFDRVLTLRYGKTFFTGSYFIVALTIIYVLHSILAVQYSQLMATVSIVAAYVAQLRHFAVKRTAEGTKPSLYFLFAFGLTLLTYVMAITDVSIYVIMTEIVNVILLLICGTVSTILKRKEAVQ